MRTGEEKTTQALETRLPRKVPVIIQEVEDNLDDEEGTRLIKEIRAYLGSKLFTWEEYDENFSFDLPNSIFTEHTRINYLTRENLAIIYSDSERNLKSEQFSQIWLNGQFEVFSKVEGLPYVWKLSQWTVKGYENLKFSFYSDLSWSFYFLYALRYRFSMKNFYHFVCSVPSSIYGLVHGMWYIFDLLIGLKNGEQFKQTFGLDTEIRRRYLMNLLREFPEVNPHIYTTKEQSLFSALTEEFDRTWENESLELEKNLYDENLELGKIKTILREERNRKYLDLVASSPLFDEDKKKLLLDYLIALIEYSQIELEYQQSLSNSRKEIEKQLTQAYPIRSKVQSWLSDNLEAKFNEVKIHLKIERDYRISHNIDQFEVPSIIFKENSKFETNFKHEYADSEKAAAVITYGANNFKVMRLHLPPFKVVESVNQSTNRLEYHMEKSTEYTVESTFIFWRLWLFLVRYLVYSWNVFVFCLITSINSSFGLKALGAETIYMNTDVRIESGQVYYTNATFTYRSVVRNLLKWIKESREEFEDAPDTGLFGKNFARLLNLFSNYVLKLILCGIFVLFGYPALILAWTALSIILAFTSPAWMLLAMIFYQLFTILIYDCDAREFNCPLVPILTYSICHCCIQGAIQMFLTLVALIVQPIFSILMILFALIRFTLRFLYDCVTFLIVRCLAKLPHSDSALAWKISGPGISRRLFNQITLQDAMTILHAQLEKEKLFYFESRVLQRLNEPNVVLCHKLAPMFKQLNLIMDFPSDNAIRYKNRLDLQLKMSINMLPTARDVKFRIDELESLKAFAQEHIMEYIKKEKMDFIWKMFNLPEDSYKRLTEKLLCKAFDDNILEPFDEADFRVELSSNFNNALEELKNKLFDMTKLNKFSFSLRQNPKSKVNLPMMTTLNDIRKDNQPFDISINCLNEEELRVVFGNDYRREDI